MTQVRTWTVKLDRDTGDYYIESLTVRPDYVNLLIKDESLKQWRVTVQAIKVETAFKLAIEIMKAGG